MQQPITQNNTMLSTCCGTVLSVFSNITSQDLAKTAILAAIGAATSFIVSVSLKLLFRKLSKK
jgi:cell division protein FtsW (lipid II flippase)